MVMIKHICVDLMVDITISVFFMNKHIYTMRGLKIHSSQFCENIVIL